jgi:CPA1 family monovalent cation:H+ antiporter
MRGVVSLAAALSIPLTLSDGSAFPHRNLILYITFVVILATLLIQGLTLPLVIKKIKLPEYHDYLPEEETENRIRKELAQVSLDYIDTHHANVKDSIHLKRLAHQWEVQMTLSEEDSGLPDHVKSIYEKILEKQRSVLLDKNKHSHDIDEELIRKYLHYIDLEEEKMKFK